MNLNIEGPIDPPDTDFEDDPDKHLDGCEWVTDEINSCTCWEMAESAYADDVYQAMMDEGQ